MASTFPLYPASGVSERAEKVGFRFGAKGTHTSRTIMLDELSTLLAATPDGASREYYAAKIIDENCLGKATAATRRLTNQRLGELYSLDIGTPIFRVLRRLWALDEIGRPLLALQCAIARDPLLAATVSPVVGLPVGCEFQRDSVRAALREIVDERLNEATLDKVVRNVASSWAQSGHLSGRTFKRRSLVRPTPVSIAFGLYLGYTAGFRGTQLFSTGWILALDCTPISARDLALEAKRIGLIDLRISGEVVDLMLDRLDSTEGRS